MTEGTRSGEPGPEEMAPPAPLSPEDLCRLCDPAELGFKTTDELDGRVGIIGQERAVDAVRFGVGIDKDGYNMYALGPSGTGKYSLIRQFLEGRAKRMATPPDTCYVFNFHNPIKPNMIQVPAGRGREFQVDMAQLLDLVKAAIPRAFEGEEYRSRRQQLEARFRSAHDELFSEIQEEGETENIVILRTPHGLALAPVKDGEVVNPQEFEQLPDEEKERIRSVMERLQAKLQNAMAKLPGLERKLREEARELNQSMTMFAIGHLIDDLKAKYEGLPEIQAYLGQVQADMVEHAQEFLRDEQATERSLEPSELMGVPIDAIHGPHGFEGRYRVNLLVDNSELEGAPVVYEDLPNLQSLIGRIEHIARFGTLTTDFSLIRSGALHRANGGYLILDLRKVLMAPFAWEELKRAIKSKEIRIESPERLLSVATTITLEPEPTPLDIKVVLLCDRILYYLLAQFDYEFGELFKVEVDFEETWDRTPETMRLYAQMIANIIRHQKLKPFDASAVARVISHTSRMAGDSKKMTTHIRSVSDLLDESDYWAKDAGKGVVTVEEVERAIEAKERRVDRIREESYEQIARGTVLIDTKGEAVGQVNGLSVVQLGKFPFGRPSRITARVRLGRGQVVDIEREVELGGPLHSKGVLILSGFLGARYCPEFPLSLSASLVFEQSYGGVEGDSASSTELYALLSALSDAPIKQSLAVTGSVNQHGQVQAIGGANEKIEGFYDICKADGLTGDQGVLIPASNVQHLMLKREVIEAVRDGRFHIYPVTHIDQGISLLTGRPAGTRGADGKFPADSINGLVEAKLQGFAEAARRFARNRAEEDGSNTRS